MGTRSAIGIKNSDGSVTAIYCHWDGYPSHNGRILQDHYSDLGKVYELLALGDLSSLAEEIGSKHPFETYDIPEKVREAWKTWCTAYGRDRGETGIESRDFVSLADYFNRFGGGAEYFYLFDNGVWMVQPSYGKATWRPVADYLKEEKEVDA